MTLDGIRQAFMVRMATWTDAPVAWDGLPTPPAVEDAQTNGDPWVYAATQNGDTLLDTLDDDTAKTGLLALQVLTAEDVGEKSANDIADSLITHLAHYRTADFKVRQANVNRVGPANGYYRINLLFPFLAD